MSDRYRPSGGPPPGRHGPQSYHRGRGRGVSDFHHGRGRGGGRGRGRGGGGYGHHPYRNEERSGVTRYGDRQDAAARDLSFSATGAFGCDYVDPNPPSSSTEPANEPYRCNFRCRSALALMLHKADRHLIFPEGGLEELKKHDPMLIAEERERLDRIRRQRNKERFKDRKPHPLPAKPGLAPTSLAEDPDNEEEAEDSIRDNHDDEDSEAEENEDGDRDEPRILDGPPDATISGLNIQLNTPELIEEWISQRKKRWPTQSVVEQKNQEQEERRKRSEQIYGPRFTRGKRPKEEAEIPVSDTPLRDEKRPKADEVQFSGSGAALTAQGEEEGPNIDGPPEETTTHDTLVKPNRADLKHASSDCEDSDEDLDNACPEESTIDHRGEDNNVLKEDTISDGPSDDEAPEEISSKAPAEREDQALKDQRPICQHFLQGRCSFGNHCRKRHEVPADASSSKPTPPPRQRRPHPRPPPVNPFDQPDLLRQLLKNEIGKHVDAVAQAIRFIVDNDMLLHVEMQEGQAEEQRKKRARIQVVDSEPASASHEEAAPSALGEPQIEQPLVEGGLLVMRQPNEKSVASDTTSAKEQQPRASLYRPPSPDLRPLSELKYPPEPDPFIYMDPLRQGDPKPLLPSQLVTIAKDPVVRSVLTPSSIIYPNGHKPKGLERAIISVDALPSDAYRNAALEMILGVSETVTAGGSAGLSVTSKDGKRKITESDLFRMGLRVGGDEVLAIKKLADRLTFLLDSSLQLDQVDAQDLGLLDANEREEKRRQYYAKEADRLDRLRKLGIDV